MTVTTTDDWARQRMGRRLIIVGASGLFLGLIGFIMTFAVQALGPDAFGLILAAFGVIQLIEVARTTVPDQRNIRMVLGLLYLGSGGALVGLPHEGLGATAVVVAILIMASGVTRAIWTYAWPGAPRFLAYLTIAAYIVFAGLVFVGWPIWALWVAGCIVSLDLSFYGATSILVGLAVRGGPSDGNGPSGG